MYCPGHAGMTRNDRADRPPGKSDRADRPPGKSDHKWLNCVSKFLKCEGELKTLPAGTEPSTSHHRSPGRERRDREIDGRYSLKGRDEQWNCFKGNAGKTSERWARGFFLKCGAQGFFLTHRYRVEVNLTEPCWQLGERPR